jgi:hypothetical protein
LSQNYFNIERCLFILVFLLDTIVMNDESPKQIITPFAFHLSSIEFHECNEFEFNLSCMQCHSIFSIKLNLDFTKINSFSHHFIINGNAKQCRAQVELCNVQMFYEYVVFWYHFRKNMFIILCAWKILNIIYYLWQLCVHVIHTWTHLCKLCQNFVIKFFCVLGHGDKISIMCILGRN